MREVLVVRVCAAVRHSVVGVGARRALSDVYTVACTHSLSSRTHCCAGEDTVVCTVLVWLMTVVVVLGVVRGLLGEVRGLSSVDMVCSSAGPWDVGAFTRASVFRLVVVRL